MHKLKKYFSVLLCATMITSLSACGNTIPKQNNSINELLSSNENESETDELQNLNGDEMNQEEFSKENIDENLESNQTTSFEEQEMDLENINAMIPWMDSLMMCMYENNLTFDTTDTYFIWRNLFYQIGVWNMESEDVIMQEDMSGVLVSADSCLSYLKAIGITELPELNVETGVVESENGYLFGLGDRGESESRLVTFTKNTDESFDVTVNLVTLYENEGDIICTGVFHLINESSEKYPLTITNVEITKPMPVIQSGKIIEITDETITFQLNEEIVTLSIPETIKENINNKSIGDYVDFMAENNILINILN